MSLFQDDWGVDESPVDNTEITTTLLYFSKEELMLFKKLCREGIRKEFGSEFQEKGNISDLLLIALKKQYANT